MIPFSKRALGVAFLFVGPPTAGLLFRSAGYDTAISLFAVILANTVILWGFNLVDDFIPPLIAVVISVFIGLAPASQALGGFASPTLLTLLGVFALAAGISLSGLAERFGLIMLLRLPNHPFVQQMGFVITGLLMSPFVSSSNSRTALILPLCQTTSKLLNLPDRGPAKTSLVAAAFGGASLFSPMLATSKSASIIGLSLLPRQVQTTYLGLFWLKAAAVVVITLFIAQALILVHLQGNQPPARIDRAALLTKLAVLGPVTNEQKLVMAALGGYSAGLLTQSWHHIDVAWISGVTLAFLLTTGVLTKKRFRDSLEWPLIFFLIGNSCLVDIMDYVGFSAVLSDFVNTYLGFTAGNIWLFVGACLVVTVAVRICLPLNAGMLVAFVVLLPLATAQGINPWICLFACGVFSDIWFMPYQNSAYIQLQSVLGETFNAVTFLRSKQWLNLAALIGMALSVPYWQQLGLI
jgi:branched-chain amino acid transport system substrate-binding protein